MRAHTAICCNPTPDALDDQGACASKALFHPGKVGAALLDSFVAIVARRIGTPLPRWRAEQMPIRHRIPQSSDNVPSWIWSFGVGASRLLTDKAAFADIILLCVTGERNADLSFSGRKRRRGFCLVDRSDRNEHSAHHAAYRMDFPGGDRHL